MSVAEEILGSMDFGDDDPEQIDTPEVAPPKAEPEPETATEPAPDGEPIEDEVAPEAPQDLLIPHGDTRFPEQMWNRPVSDLAKSYQEAVRKINEQGAEKNAALQQAQIFQIAFDRLQKQQQAAQPQEPQNPYGYNPDEEFWQNPQKVLADTARIARDQALAEVAPRIQAIEQREQRSDYESRVNQVRQTAEAARQHLGVDQETWESRAEMMVSLAEFGKLIPTNFDSWVQNYERAWPRSQPTGSIPQQGTVRGALPGAVKPSAMSAPTGRKVAARPDAIGELLRKSHPLFRNQPDEFFADIAEELEQKKETR